MPASSAVSAASRGGPHPSGGREPSARFPSGSLRRSRQVHMAGEGCRAAGFSTATASALWTVFVMSGSVDMPVRPPVPSLYPPVHSPDALPRDASASSRTTELPSIRRRRTSPRRPVGERETPARFGNGLACRRRSGAAGLAPGPPGGTRPRCTGRSAATSPRYFPSAEAGRTPVGRTVGR